MYEELKYEFEIFLEDMKRGEVFCRYIDESDYEDEYSHNAIYECQSDFIEKTKKWLHENKPNQYVITSGWCVFVMTVEEAQKRKMLRIEDYIVR